MKFNKFFKSIIDKKFLLPALFLLIMQAMFYVGVKFLQHDYHFIISSIDSKIPFIPDFVYIYNLFYPFIFLVLYYIFINNEKAFKQTIIVCIIGFLVCDVIYIFYPTIMNRPHIDYNDINKITSFILKVTYLVDNPPLNCFPSIHALFCIQIQYSIIICKNISLKNKVIIIGFAFLIVISTVLVKQHYFYDIIASLIVCIMVNIIVCLYNKKSHLFQ